MPFRDLGELLLVAICVVWYNPEFFPPAQTAREFRALTLALPTDGSEDTQAKVLLLSQEIDLRLLQPMMLHRLAEPRKEKAQPIEAADQQEFQEAHHVVEADRDVADGVEAEETAVFRDNVKVGDQVAILVDRDEEGVPFLIGNVIGIVQGPGPLKIQWFSPAVKKSGVTGKWTADCLPVGVGIR